MKTKLVLLASAFIFLISCKKSTDPKNEAAIPNEELFTATERQCASYEVLEEQLKNDPTLRSRMEAIEEFTKRIAENPDGFRVLPNGKIEIPVVFNVLY